MTNQPMQLNADGTWTPSTPIPLSDDLDFEVTGNGPYSWEAWRGMNQVAAGSAHTRLGLQVALLRARRKHSN